jgi:hypothetical protein
MYHVVLGEIEWQDEDGNSESKFSLLHYMLHGKYCSIQNLLRE